MAGGNWDGVDPLKEWLKPMGQAVGAQLRVTDDADAFKMAVDELGPEHQICESHGQRNLEALLDELKPKVESDEDGSLAEIGVLPEQASKDLDRLRELIRSRLPEAEKEREEMHRRCLDAAPPGPGQKATVAYRLRLLFLDRWNLWRRLTRYRTWRGPHGETVDGTNNAVERAIGWWVQERWRTMRGDKCRKSAANVSCLLAWCGNHLGRGGADLASRLA